MKHPLEHIALQAARRHGNVIDVTDLAYELAGSVVRGPEKGNGAYRIVAADILCVMHQQGKLEQFAPWTSKRCPEKGGAYFRLLSPKKEKR